MWLLKSPHTTIGVFGSYLMTSLMMSKTLLALSFQYQLDHATFLNSLGAYCHYMIDSSLTTPLPHLKS